jgi:hypothetical protein
VHYKKKSQFRQNQRLDYSTSESPSGPNLMGKSAQATHHRTIQSSRHRVFAIISLWLQAPYKPVEDYEAKDKIKKEEEGAGQDLNSRSPPCQGILITNIEEEKATEQTDNQSNLGVDRESKSCPPIAIDWEQFINSFFKE